MIDLHDLCQSPCLNMTLGAEQTSTGEYVERIGALTEAKADYACPCTQYC
jgi:hypothetical protein